MSLWPPIGVRFDPSAFTRRDLKHSGDGLVLNWPMYPDRHPGILQFVSYFATQLTKLEGKCGLASLPRSRPGQGGGNEGIRIGQGIRFQPFSAYFGPWGVGSGPFSYFLGSPILSPLFVLFFPYSPGVVYGLFQVNIVATCSCLSPRFLPSTAQLH